MGLRRAGARAERGGGGGGEGRVLPRDAFGSAALLCALVSTARQPARVLRHSAARHPARVGAPRFDRRAPPHNARAFTQQAVNAMLATGVASRAVATTAAEGMRATHVWGTSALTGRPVRIV